MTRPRFRPFIAIILALALTLASACLLAPSSRAGDKRLSGNPACATPSLAWRVDSATATVWLFGSIHFATQDAYPLCPPVRDAFAQAQALAVELDTTIRAKEIQDQVVKTGFLPKGQNLSDLLPEDVKAMAREQGVNLELYQRFRPWYFAVLVQVQKFMALGYLPEYGLDQHFLNKAHERNMPVLELETVEQQLGLLRSLAEMDTETYLRQFFTELAGLETMAKAIYEDWSEGDAPGLAGVLFGQLADHPEYETLYDQLYFERNARMADTVEGYLKGGRNVFVVVGAGHLVGDRSVLDELADRGYTATQLEP